MGDKRQRARDEPSIMNGRYFVVACQLRRSPHWKVERVAWMSKPLTAMLPKLLRSSPKRRNNKRRRNNGLRGGLLIHTSGALGGRFINPYLCLLIQIKNCFKMILDGLNDWAQ